MDPIPPSTEPAPSIASLIEGMSGPAGGWRVQIASVKSEDIAKSTWARLQAAHGDVLGSLRMQPTKIDLKRDEKLEITWADGKHCTYPIAMLRAMCAHCQDCVARAAARPRRATSRPDHANSWHETW